MNTTTSVTLTSLYWFTVLSSMFALAVSIIHREFSRCLTGRIIGAGWLLVSVLTLAAYGYHVSRQLLYCNEQLKIQAEQSHDHGAKR